MLYKIYKHYYLATLLQTMMYTAPDIFPKCFFTGFSFVPFQTALRSAPLRNGSAADCLYFVSNYVL